MQCTTLKIKKKAKTMQKDKKAAHLQAQAMQIEKCASGGLCEGVCREKNLSGDTVKCPSHYIDRHKKQDSSRGRNHTWFRHNGEKYYY